MIRRPSSVLVVYGLQGTDNFWLDKDRQERQSIQSLIVGHTMGSIICVGYCQLYGSILIITIVKMYHNWPTLCVVDICTSDQQKKRRLPPLILPKTALVLLYHIPKLIYLNVRPKPKHSRSTSQVGQMPTLPQFPSKAAHCTSSRYRYR